MQGIQPVEEPPLATSRRRIPLLGLVVLGLVILAFLVLWRARGKLSVPVQQNVSAPAVVDPGQPEQFASQPAVLPSAPRAEPVVSLADQAMQSDGAGPLQAQDASVEGPFPALKAAANADPVGTESGATVDLSQDPENEALGGVLTVFSLEPLAAPCCPLPTNDKAVDAARSVPGVLAAKVNDDGALLVRFDPAQTNPDAIASAVNQASFIVEIAEQAE